MWAENLQLRERKFGTSKILEIVSNYHPRIPRDR
jgi:hypothetical protein